MFKKHCIFIFHSLKYVRSTTLDCKDKFIRKIEFVAKTQFRYFESQTLIFQSKLCSHISKPIKI